MATSEHFEEKGIMSELELPKADLKFFVSWLVCSIAMFGLSYAWHGMVLNDFVRISYPKDVFLLLISVIYLGVGFVITILTYVLKRAKNSFKYGIVVGAVFGVGLYLIAFVLGISFNAIVSLKMIAFDLGWQVFEQSFGGLVCGWTYRFLYHREKRLQMLRNE